MVFEKSKPNDLLNLLSKTVSTCSTLFFYDFIKMFLKKAYFPQNMDFSFP